VIIDSHVVGDVCVSNSSVRSVSPLISVFAQLCLIKWMCFRKPYHLVHCWMKHCFVLIIITRFCILLLFLFCSWLFPPQSAYKYWPECSSTLFSSLHWR